MFNVKLKDKTIQVEEHTSIVDIAKEYANDYENDIILAMYNGKLAELNTSVQEDCTLEFVTTSDKIGSDCYRRSVVFMMLKAIYKILGREQIEKVSIKYSISKGLYCELHSDVEVTDEFLEKVSAEMKSLSERDILLLRIQCLLARQSNALITME